MEWRGIPLLEADFWLTAFVAEEKHILFGDKGREGLGILELCGEIRLVIANPTRTLWHVGYANCVQNVTSSSRACSMEGLWSILQDGTQSGLVDVRGSRRTK